jgi:hypothetical protein
VAAVLLAAVEVWVVRLLVVVSSRVVAAALLVAAVAVRPRRLERGDSTYRPASSSQFLPFFRFTKSLATFTVP